MRSTMNVSLPAALKDWVEEQVSQKGYSTASEYVRDLLRREQQMQLRAHVDQRLTDALNSGDATPMTKRDWERIRREGLKRAATRRRK